MPDTVPESHRRRRQPVYWFNNRTNFGDMLAPVVLRALGGVDPMWVEPARKGKLLAIGSILHALQPGDVVWGSGSIRRKRIRVPGIRYLAVRGPLTKACIDGDVPEVFGDPAMLLPHIYQPNTTKRYELGLIPHYVDQDIITSSDPSIPVIDVLRPWQEVVDAITACHSVASSSLHGLIIAEAYGVAASWLRASDRVIGGGFKFNDYYLSTNRPMRQPVFWSQGIKTAMRLMAEPPLFDASPLLAAWHHYAQHSSLSR